MITRSRAFRYIQQAENTFFKNLLTYSIDCVRFRAHVSAFYYIFD